jgi:hypothetical protein
MFQPASATTYAVVSKPVTRDGGGIWMLASAGAPCSANAWASLPTYPRFRMRKLGQSGRLAVRR